MSFEKDMLDTLGRMNPNLKPLTEMVKSTGIFDDMPVAVAPVKQKFQEVESGPDFIELPDGTLASKFDFDPITGEYLGPDIKKSSSHKL